jgi:mRNA interferase RelE/StbE
MKWQINYSRSALKFIDQQNIRDDVKELLIKFLRKIEGKAANVDLKKLDGDWEGYYRVRKQKIRIIFEIHKTEKIIYVEKVDFRGSVYK